MRAGPSRHRRAFSTMQTLDASAGAGPSRLRRPFSTMQTLDASAGAGRGAPLAGYLGWRRVRAAPALGENRDDTWTDARSSRGRSGARRAPADAGALRRAAGAIRSARGRRRLLVHVVADPR